MKPDITCFNWIKMVQKSSLGAYEKSVAHYLSTYMNQNQDVAWPSQSRMFTEMSIAKSTLNKSLNALESKGWLVRERGCPNKNTRYLINVPTEAIQLALEGSPSHGLVRHTDEGSPSHVLGVVRDTDTNNKVITNNSKRGASRFTPPTLDQVQSYVREKSYRGVDCKLFMAHYETTGWMVGKNKMKCWKSAVAKWNMRQKEFSGNDNDSSGSTRRRVKH